MASCSWVENTIGYIRNRIDGAIDSCVLLVNDEAKHGEESGVNEGDPEADDADWKHEDEEVAGEGDEEAGDPLQHQADQGQGPLKREVVKMFLKIVVEEKGMDQE